MEPTFGAFIRAERLFNQLSVVGLADRVGCHMLFLRGIEREAQFPSLVTAIKILEGLGIDFKIKDDHTIEVIEGPTFTFKSRRQDDNGTGTAVKKNKDRIADLEARVQYLEDQLRRLK